MLIAPDAHPFGCRDLIAHQGQQGGHDQRGPETSVSEHSRGNEVDCTLTPARSLDQQQPLAAAHQGINRLPLSVSEFGLVVGEQAPQ